MHPEPQSEGTSDDRQTALSIVIVSFNSAGMIDDCLASLPAGAAGLACETVVVDNDSDDNTVEFVRNRFPKVTVIANRVNTGFARACNQGLRVSRGRYLLLLNPDTVSRPNCLRTTFEYMERNPRLAAASCKVVRPDGTLDPSCKRDFPSVWDGFCRAVGLSRIFPTSRLFARYDTFYLDEDSTQEVPLIDACYMMIRRSALDEIGDLDERFFMYLEEMDWCRRAHDRGWSIGYDPSGETVHIKGETTKNYPFRMLYHFHRSMWLYQLKYHRWWNPLNLIVLPGILLRLLMLILLNLFRRERRVSG